jgi:hypothetical protein
MTNSRCSWSSSKGFVLIGDGGDGVLPCPGNGIDGAVTVNQNTGGVELGGNPAAAVTVSGNLAPTQGTPMEDAATEIEGNHIGGKLTLQWQHSCPHQRRSPQHRAQRSGRTDVRQRHVLRAAGLV